MLKLSLPVKDPKLIEIVDCSICNETVQYEGVLCDTCQCWVHPACNGLTPLDIKELNDTQTTWQCNKCNPPPQSIYTDKNEKLKLYFETFDDCKMCQKPVKTNQSICCALCRHWIHGKCLRIFRKGEFKQFNDKLKHTDWYCPKCMDENLPFHNLSDEELAFHCFESNNVHIDTSSEQMKVIFKQLNQSNMFDKHIFDNDDANSRQYDNDITNMDPDAHFSYKDCCKYVFNLSEVKIDSKSFSVLTFNTRSIRNKLNTLTAHLNSLTQQPDIIALTETWLTDNDNTLDYQIDNYNIPIISNRSSKNNKQFGGGLMTYIHKNINNYTLNKKLSFTTSTDQCQVIDFKIENRKHTLINCYRPPQADPIPFIEKLDETIRHVKKNNCVITGDFNLNLLNISVHEPTEKYYNMLLSNSFKPIITKPTRITDKSQTIIDHIWTNDLRTDISPKGYIYITDISDHMPCLATFGTSYKRKGYTYRQFRLINDKNKTEFRKSIEKAAPAMLFHCNNPFTSTEQKYNDFFNHFSYIYDQHFPIRRKKIHWKTAEKPWITDAIMKKIEKGTDFFQKRHQMKKQNLNTNN